MNKRMIMAGWMLVLALAVMAQQRAKYVFYFIGDGMGVNQVNAAETYLGAINGRIGIEPLCFPSFPYFALVNTQSANSGITDSAAGGTALATGSKTHNGALGLNADLSGRVSSLADWARAAGAAVGITTSVTIDHATPAAFYAHVKDRKMAYDIGLHMISSGNDFYAGSDLSKPKNPSKGGPDLYEQAESKGYTLAYGYDDYTKKKAKAERMILMQTKEANKRDHYSLPYAIDRTPEDMTLAQVTTAAIDFLMQKQGGKDGFFLMVEGGKIDWTCHANDLAFIPELIDMDNAIKVAYEFYRQHPDETLIVVTADHETGGLSLGRRKYELHLDVVAHQKMSIEKLGKRLHEMRQQEGDKYSWEMVRDMLKENFGFWDKVKLEDKQTARLQEAFNHIIEGTGKTTKTLYQQDDELADTVRDVMAQCANVSWGTPDHSNGYVPCFAIGQGAEAFHGRIDNTEISTKIAKAAAWSKTNITR